MPLGEAFRKFRQHSGRKHEDDNWDYQVPPAARYLLEWFWELTAGRPAGPSGWLGLPATEIEAWAALRRIVMRPWELDAIRALDAKFLEVMGERS